MKSKSMQPTSAVLQSLRISGPACSELTFHRHWITNMAISLSPVLCVGYLLDKKVHHAGLETTLSRSVSLSPLGRELLEALDQSLSPERVSPLRRRWKLHCGNTFVRFARSIAICSARTMPSQWQIARGGSRRVSDPRARPRG